VGAFAVLASLIEWLSPDFFPVMAKVNQLNESPDKKLHFSTPEGAKAALVGLPLLLATVALVGWGVHALVRRFAHSGPHQKAPADQLALIMGPILLAIVVVWLGARLGPLVEGVIPEWALLALGLALWGGGYGALNGWIEVGYGSQTSPSAPAAGQVEPGPAPQASPPNEQGS
jgi:hypothetical protein